MDPNQTKDQQNQDLMIAPEDALMKMEGQAKTEDLQSQTQTAPGVSYTPPQAWGADQTASPTETPTSPLSDWTPPLVSTSTQSNQDQSSPLNWTSQENQNQTPDWTNPQETITQTTTTVPREIPTPQVLHTDDSGHSSPLRTFLVTLSLILLGILFGVMASRFLPVTPAVPAEVTPTVEPTVELTPVVTINPTPTATSAALMNLKWNMMTVNSPVTLFKSYRLYYPTTWSIKEYKNVPKADDLGSSTLKLTKGSTTLNIFQSKQLSPICDYSGNIEADGVGIVLFGEFKGIVKNDILFWRTAPRLNVTIPEYLVCQLETPDTFVASTSLGFINFSGEAIDTDTLEEINYMLEKIVILP